MKVDCPVCRITDDRKVTAMHVAMQVSLVGQQRWWVTGSLSEIAGILCGRVADVLHRRPVVERAAAVHESWFPGGTV